ncbi:MAG: ribonuclease P protein component, partial [Bacteroidia bacterium]|nr:ribonuclease P protein component [Bacteroidia bacterium]
IVKTAVSVGKKQHKKAVDRNSIKRLIREVFRLNKPFYFNNLKTQYALMILYIGTEIPVFSSLNNSMKGLLEKFKTKIYEQD